MPVHVRMFTTLVALSKTKQPSFDVDWREGMTVAEIVAAEGFSEQDAEAIAAIVNSEQSEFDRTLHDGDEVEFIVNLQGARAWIHWWRTCPIALTRPRAAHRIPTRTDGRIAVVRRVQAS